ncbi:MAG: 2,3-bisphosphoglycerate-independent phosphoglycerate mutase, partial [Candidatus Aenigmatarchaeota archaeon]
IVLDGLGDRPCKVLGGKTPLEAASTPNIDKLVREGVCGSLKIMDIAPESDEGHMTLFGYNLKKYYPGRGPIEAAGVGLTLQHGDVAFRANMATVSGNMIVVDRRAGRIAITEPFANKANGMEIDGVKFLVKAGNAHRMALVMRGEGLSANITNTDPHENGKGVLKSEPSDSSSEAAKTAELLNRFLAETHKIFDNMPENEKRRQQEMLPANQILTRGAGYFRAIPSFKHKYKLKACCVTGGGLYHGLGRILGMTPIIAPGATGNEKTDVQAKLCTAMKGLKQYDFAFVHIKATDIFGHDNRPHAKKKFIEKVDRAFPSIKNFDGLIVITSDHSTPCELKDHSADPVPLVIWGAGKRDSVGKFSENACALGALGKLQGKDLMPLVLKMSS